MTAEHAAAAAIIKLINTSPRTPSVAEIANVIATAGSHASPLTLEIRRVRSLWEAAITQECNTDEKTPAYQAARAYAQGLGEEFETLCREAWRRPVNGCSRDDLALLCEAALPLHPRNADGALCGLDDDRCLGERAIAQLLVAVAAFAGCSLSP